MTDITELALLVSKAKASVFTLENISQFEPADIDSDDVDLRFEVDGMDTGTNVSIVDECGQAAKVIGVLVEALEKAQRANAAQDDHINQQQDRIDTLEKRNAELGREVTHLQSLKTVNAARQEAQSEFHRGYSCGHKDASLESRTVTPVTYSENADADYCRKWAWEQVKGEVSTEDWTTGDSITYFGFFCWGWDMRRQYNEQRPVTVKLPQRLQPGADGWDDWYVHSDDEGEYLKFDDVLAMLTAAGIKWEAE